MVNYLPLCLCLFKVLVRESYLYSDATSSTIWTQISNLDTYLSKTGNNIVKLNAHVQNLINTFTSRGGDTHYLI